jgi:hypothetical protein
MTQYIAIMNTPGYLPWSDDEPYPYDTPGEAWDYLASERREQEDSSAMADDASEDQPYSGTVQELDAYASANHGPDVVYGGTPGYEGDHDLGIAYSVNIYEADTD